MPTARKKPRPQYSVLVLRYASIQDKNKLAHGEIPAFTSEVVHMGSSERIALYHFGRACITQSGDELAYSVTLKRDGFTSAEVKPVKPL